MKKRALERCEHICRIISRSSREPKGINAEISAMVKNAFRQNLHNLSVALVHCVFGDTNSLSATSSGTVSYLTVISRNSGGAPVCRISMT